ncbi:uncharacterized protein SPPG_06720 [Spizellomyces punctatus DAOM BR117]|uniref:LSM domain-containing protein n=1 Tax=Spizellomyces punctatus (strain DAOM BR117) TaxID=645134 RepID=A0A0L0HAV5_SPIPD|nr:uncharacterized protein SPPG_06720 [Spizellomyces punctatus DAOM BR117]KNC98327.1 hypothetical protein SPPG_06720 [Spizellomyces punctatus DAOM BR117]|eukprot:XP_016606367.1 hypothetical protein SPPG_06720 [Spizellomyces punctatus DAOM BR117]
MGMSNVSLSDLVEHLRHPVWVRLSNGESLNGYLLNVDPETLHLILVQKKPTADNEEDDGEEHDSPGHARPIGGPPPTPTGPDHQIVVVMHHSITGIEPDLYSDNGPEPLSESQVEVILNKISRRSCGDDAQAADGS